MGLVQCAVCHCFVVLTHIQTEQTDCREELIVCLINLYLPLRDYTVGVLDPPSSWQPCPAEKHRNESQIIKQPPSVREMWFEIN